MPYVYLLHFNEPIKGVRHYVGFTENLRQRIDTHRSGSRHASGVCRRFYDAGIPFRVARIWAGEKINMTVENYVKKHISSMCSICAWERENGDLLPLFSPEIVFHRLPLIVHQAAD
jgi:predicted GIY-YIG superfamily endonuclease